MRTYVRSADWDSTTDTWTVHAEHDGADKTYRCRFLFFGTGYYNYDTPYSPEFRGIEDFTRLLRRKPGPFRAGRKPIPSFGPRSGPL